MATITPAAVRQALDRSRDSFSLDSYSELLQWLCELKRPSHSFVRELELLIFTLLIRLILGIFADFLDEACTGQSLDSFGAE